MIDRGAALPIVRQCELLELSRSSVYYEPRPVSAADLALMRRLDELHLAHPFLGATPVPQPPFVKQIGSSWSGPPTGVAHGR